MPTNRTPVHQQRQPHVLWRHPSQSSHALLAPTSVVIVPPKQNRLSSILFADHTPASLPGDPTKGFAHPRQWSACRTASALSGPVSLQGTAVLSILRFPVRRGHETSNPTPAPSQSH